MQKEAPRAAQPIGSVGTSYQPIGTPNIAALRANAKPDPIAKVVSPYLSLARLPQLTSYSLGDCLYPCAERARQHTVDAAATASDCAPSCCCHASSRSTPHPDSCCIHTTCSPGCGTPCSCKCFLRDVELYHLFGHSDPTDTGGFRYNLVQACFRRSHWPCGRTF